MGKVLQFDRRHRSAPMMARSAAGGGMPFGKAAHAPVAGRGPATITSLYGGGRADRTATLAVSVVVPTCGRPTLLNRCLKALTYQNLLPATYEIIVVDDAPNDATREAVAEWAERNAERGLSVRYIPSHGPHGPAAARNRGWRAAKSEIVAFTDDDTMPEADWLKNALDAFDPGVDAIWGSIVMPLSRKPTDYERDAKGLEVAEFVTANCLCRKRVLEALDGFDERFRLAWREDADFYFRLLQRHAQVRHVPEAVVIHPVRPARWGVSLSQQKKVVFDVLLFKKHPSLYRRKIRPSPRWDYYLTVLALLVCVGTAIAGLPFVATAAGLLWLALTARFCAARLRGTVKTPSHVAEMVVTSAVIPPLAVFWRIVGMLRFRTLLA